jgi:hypothetical protein
MPQPWGIGRKRGPTGPKPEATNDLPNPVRRKLLVPTWQSKPFRVELRRDQTRTLSGRHQFPNPLDQPTMPAQLLVAEHWADQLVPADSAAHPTDRDLHRFGIRGSLDFDALDHVAQDGLPVRRTRDRSQTWNILGQCGDSFPIGIGQLPARRRLRSAELFLQPLFGAQGFLPAPLKFARHQPVLWLSRIKLSQGSLGQIPCSLQLQLPVPLALVSLFL